MILANVWLRNLRKYMNYFCLTSSFSSFFFVFLVEGSVTFDIQADLKMKHL